ncbi:MAG: murein biosynthesis integral membrane protein MurJ [Candidatus Atribacteria bacterium]|nr:murein biosynthesis integral membrane protein MurJ [Candidatus Atribacteria bacterium]
MVKERSLIKNTAIVGAGTFLSRITGLLREILVSSMFGASWVTDVFFVAYTIPNLLRRLFAEGALSTSVVPVFSQYSEKSHQESRKFIYSVFTGLTLVVSVVCIIGIAFSPWIVKMVGIGFRSEPEKIQMATHMTRIMFPFLLIISWSALVMGILNTIHIFSWSAIAPVFFNAGTILTLLLFKAFAGPYSLAIGVLIGGIGQFVIQLYPFYKKGYALRFFKRFWSDPGFREVIRLMLPVTLALAVGQLNTLVDRIIASTCQEGAVSALYYADRLLELPLGIFGIALSTAILPSLSQLVFKNNPQEWNYTFTQGIRLVLFIMIPITSYLAIFRNEAIRLIYERGMFDANATQMTAQSLLFYVPGLVFFSMNHIITKAFYSLKDTVTPVRISVIMVGVNVILDLLLVRYFSFSGLALATSLVAVLNCICLFYFLKRKHTFYKKDRTIYSWLVKIVILNLLFIGFCWGILHLVQNLQSKASLLAFFGISLVVFCLIYILLSQSMGLKEGKSIWSFIRRNLGGKG